jgi:hypothetical protein
VRLLIIALILTTTSTCFAEEWITVGYINDTNTKLETKLSSIESLTDSTVRTLVRNARTDPSNQKFGDLKPKDEFVEIVIDFDCTRPRYKPAQESIITYSGDRRLVNNEIIPTYNDLSEKSLLNAVRINACKTEGKYK